MTRILQKIIHLFMPVGLALIISTILFARINLFFALILVGWIAIHLAICLAFSKKCDEYSNIHAAFQLNNNANVSWFTLYYHCITQ